MSVDRQIDQVCSHQVADEFLYVQTDRQTVAPLRPISSASSVSVLLNGQAKVPSSGVQVQARVVGTKEGPFSITSANNVLSIQVNTDSVQTVTLALASRIAPTRLADLLTRSFAGLVFFVERNRIGIRSTFSGQDATFKLLSSSTLATLLGIPTQRVFRGKNTFPGWTLVSAPNTLGDRPRRFVYFDEPLQANENFIEVTYTTVREECRRCGGIGVENDWRYGPDGKVIAVRDEALLIQELLKITYTSQGSNPFHPWYGTTIIERIGNKNSVSGVIENTISQDIYQTFTRWQSIKRQQEEDAGQVVSDEEYPFRLTGVRIEQSQQDPTVLFVGIDVQNRSFNPIQISRGLKLPEPLNLLGNTQTQGVLRQSLNNYSLVG